MDRILSRSPMFNVNSSLDIQPYLNSASAYYITLSELPKSSVLAKQPSGLAFGIVCLLLTLTSLSWRFIRPIVLRRSHPDRPLELPSWTPFFGSIPSFFSDFGNILEQMRSYAQSKVYPCSLYLGGQSICVIVSSEDADYIHRSQSGFEHEDVIKQNVARFGLSKRGNTQLWSTQDKTTRYAPGFERHRNMFSELLSMTQKEMSLFNTLEALPIRLIAELWTTSQLLMPRAVLSDDGQSKTMSLTSWTRGIVAHISTQGFWGSTMTKLNPDFYRELFAFDDSVWMLLCGTPAPWSLSMKRSLLKYQKSIAAYLSQPQSNRNDSSRTQKLWESFLVGQEGVSSVDLGKMYSMIFWGINTNTWKAAFWTLAYTINDPALLATLREEVGPIVASSSSDPVELSQKLKSSCPKLNSTYLEAIRIAATTSSHRRALTEHTLPSGSKLAPDTDLLLVYQQMLRDTDLFGSDAKQFKWDRFLKDSDLAKPPQYRPFGGGIGLCPGRFLAQAEVISMVALLITRYELQTTSKIPELDTKMPPIGMGGPVPGQDIVVRVIPRRVY